MKIFMIITDKCPNHSTGVMNGVPILVGQSYLIPNKGNLKLLDITEGTGRNGKPCVTLIHEKNVIIEMPDYGIDKYRDYSDEKQHDQTTDKGQKHK